MRDDLCYDFCRQYGAIICGSSQKLQPIYKLDALQKFTMESSLFMSKKKIMKCSYCALDFLYVMTHSLTIHPSAQLSHSTVNTGFTLHYAMWSKMLIQSYNWSVNGREQAWRKTSEHSRMYTTPHDWADNTSLSTELHLTLQAGQAPSLLTWYHD